MPNNGRRWSRPCGDVPPRSLTAVYPRPCGEARFESSTAAVYPRPCGEAALDVTPADRGGLSPPVRGSLDSSPCGSIPARAGKPRHHRTCPARSREGLSPPVRGSLVALAPARTHRWRSIPARAGKPRASRRAPSRRGLSPPVRGSRRIVPGRLSSPCRVYPRPCGEAPSMRSIHTRSIPDAASNGWSSHVGVYPRPCGEATGSMPRLSPPVCGESPPVRGSRREQRVCFGTSVPVATARAGKGLSPPVRGSRGVAAVNRTSIPARAGKPVEAGVVSRSIPARAGKPLATWRTARINWVPRCGILDALLLEWQLL